MSSQSNRCQCSEVEVQRPKVDVHHPEDGAMSQVGNPEEFKIPWEVLELYPNEISKPDKKAGWPPKVLGREILEEKIPVGISEDYFTIEDQKRNVQIALRHPKVKGLLQGRWEVLGCHLISGKYGSYLHRVRVSIFNYTTKELIDSYLEDDSVTEIIIREPNEHPESPVEMAQAISIVRGHPELKDKVAKLEAHAILRIPTDPNIPFYNHRCMYVMFTMEDNAYEEQTVKLSVLVDLYLQRVVAWCDSCRDSESSQSPDVTSKGD